MSLELNYQDDCKLDGMMTSKRNKSVSGPMRSTEVFCQEIDDFLIECDNTLEETREDEEE